MQLLRAARMGGTRGPGCWGHGQATGGAGSGSAHPRVPSWVSMGIRCPAASRGLGPAIATPAPSLGAFSNSPSSLWFRTASNFIRKQRTGEAAEEAEKQNQIRAHKGSEMRGQYKIKVNRISTSGKNKTRGIYSLSYCNTQRQNVTKHTTAIVHMRHW